MSVHASQPDNNSGGRSPRRAAFYDLDGTLADCNVLHAYWFYAVRVPGFTERLTRVTGLALNLPLYIGAELIDRRLFNEQFFRAYAGLSRDRLEQLGEHFVHDVLRPRLFRQARDLLEGNRAAGYEPVLITGSPEFVVAPLARELGVSHVAANRLLFRAGRATGRLQPPVLAGAEKARWMRDFAARQDIDLARSLAYADSAADLPMLLEVGRPHAVNPDVQLRAAARAYRWPTLRFARG